jgi:hypothetical protein
LISRSCREAAELFEDDEEQMMEFVVEHDLGATRAVILGRQGKYGEAVIQYLDEDQDSEALDLTLEHTEDVIRNANAFNTIVDRFLWRYLSFGCRGWPEGTKISSDRIFSLLERIRSFSMDDMYQKMVRDCPRCYLMMTAS